MLKKIIFVTKNKLRFISNEDLIDKCLDSNILISDLAIQELIRRNPQKINVNDNLLKKVILKMTIDELWELSNKQEIGPLVKLAYQQLIQILDYYQKLNQDEYLHKIEEKQNKIYQLR